MNRTAYRFTFSALAVGIMISACGGGGGGGGSSEPAALSGKLLDAAVQGASYSAQPSGLSGKTDSNGTFSYRDGDTVTFKLGDLTLGSVAGGTEVWPDTLAAAANTQNVAVEEVATNLARFLQTLDSDSNPDNGISLPATLPAGFSTSLSFTQTTDDFEKDFSAQTKAANLTPVSVTQARQHLAEQKKAAAANSTTKSVEISFSAVAGDTAINCGSTLTNLGTTNASGVLQDLRFYVGNVSLIRKDGTRVPVTLGANDIWNATIGTDRVTLIDLEDKTGFCGGTTDTNAVVKGTVPAGDYTGVVFSLGVPGSMNHTNQGAGTDVTPDAINNGTHPGMAWSWAAGRKFTKIEVMDAGLASEPAQPTWTAPVFMVHLGSTGCTLDQASSQATADTCVRPNRVDYITLKQFDPATQQIALDVQALLAGNDNTKNGGGAAGCMSGQTDPECPALFTNLGLDNDTGKAKSGLTQTVFKVINKAATAK